ncbi:MAG: TetR/AcrR family transcriptional regulator [Firmicutes bacterium]|nr:TetR/AcrR family transcriptional regulator [Alicyclobacillaceae bacterium]MCL6496506.1 TetR/AcrR family transcriptional regulator [Bacillota bacterium]
MFSDHNAASPPSREREGSADTKVTQERRQALLAAAQSVFAREGYHRTGIRQIAEAAGCAVGTFYLYFPSKGDCFRALIDKLYQAVMEAIEKRRSAQGAPEAKLAASLSAVTDVLMTEQDLARVVLIHARGSELALEEHLWTIQKTFARLVAQDLLECGVPEPSATVGAHAWVGALAEVVNLWARDPQLHDLRAMVHTVQALFWRGWGLPSTWPNPA